jgi:hypothetical protein
MDKMELQNILVDFKENTASTMYQDEHYNVDVIAEIELVKIEFELAYGITFSRAVVQLTEDQHLSEPRILCQKVDEQTIITIADIRDNHPALMLELDRIKLLIEEQLPNLISNIN